MACGQGVVEGGDAETPEERTLGDVMHLASEREADHARSKGRAFDCAVHLAKKQHAVRAQQRVETRNGVAGGRRSCRSMRARAPRRIRRLVVARGVGEDGTLARGSLRQQHCAAAEVGAERRGSETKPH